MLTIDGQPLIGQGILGTTVSLAQAESQFAALVARAEAGEKIIVTRSGRAVACLGPLPGRQPIKYGELSGVFLSEDLTIPEEVIRVSSRASDRRPTGRHASRSLGKDRTRTTHHWRTRALDDARSCYMSAVSLWEIAILMTLDRVAAAKAS
jgi:antitoxin (DNA-binding transcriptional repressor) of toxin-antitoxin stability system